jgi:hypothetical protein
VSVICLWGSATARAQPRSAPIPGGGGAAAPAPRQPAGGGPATGGATGGATPGGATAAPATPALPAVSIPPEAYVDSGARAADIRKFIDTYVERLVNDADPVNQGIAREELSKAAYEKGQPAQPPFLYDYAKALNTALSQKLGGNASMRQRLNIAIVTYRVTSVAENVALMDTVLKLVNDKDEPVVLWGIKAAGPVIRAAIKNMKIAPGQAPPAPPPILAAIVPAVLKHPSGEIYEEAYGALDPKDVGGGDALMVAELMKVWENRLEQYKTGVPDNASADSKPVRTLTAKTLWDTVLQKQAPRMQVMQMISDQIFAAATYADGAANKDKRDQLVSLVQKTAEGVFVVGLNMKIPTLQSAAQAAAGLKPENTPPSQKILPLVSPEMVAEIQKAFPGVKPPQPPAAAGVAQQP